MRKDNERISEGRRRFLKKTAWGGAALGLGAGASQALAFEPEETVEKAPPTAKKGYRETAHVSRYYERADW